MSKALCIPMKKTCSGVYAPPYEYSQRFDAVGRMREIEREEHRRTWERIVSRYREQNYADYFERLATCSETAEYAMRNLGIALRRNADGNT